MLHFFGGILTQFGFLRFVHVLGEHAQKTWLKVSLKLRIVFNYSFGDFLFHVILEFLQNGKKLLLGFIIIFNIFRFEINVVLQLLFLYCSACGLYSLLSLESFTFITIFNIWFLWILVWSEDWRLSSQLFFLLLSGFIILFWIFLFILRYIW